MRRHSSNEQKTFKRHTVKIDDLDPAPYNPRRIGDAELDALKHSIARFGMVQEIVVNVGEEGDQRRVVGGHQRLAAAKALGWTTVPAVFVRLSIDHEKALNVALNSTMLQGSFTESLAEVLSSIDLEDDLFSGLRFDELLDDLDEAPPANGAESHSDASSEAVPELPRKAVTKPGDLWVLGDHRLVCGDSTDECTVKALLGKSVPHLMVTDPPYGVEYDASWRNRAGINKSKKTGKVTNDDRASWASAFRFFRGPIAYIWHAAKFASAVERSLQAVGFEVRQQIIWVKKRFAISRGAYHWRHETCLYAVRGNADWIGGRKQNTVWSDIVDLPDTSGYFAAQVDSETIVAFDGSATTVWEIRHDPPTGGNHSTQKPVECMARPMRNHGAGSGFVFDPFLGTGTTLMAAELLDRRCLGLELSPAYCDVIVERWQEFSGKKAKLKRKSS